VTFTDVSSQCLSVVFRNRHLCRNYYEKFKPFTPIIPPGEGWLVIPSGFKNRLEWPHLTSQVVVSTCKGTLSRPWRVVGAVTYDNKPDPHILMTTVVTHIVNHSKARIIMFVPRSLLHTTYSGVSFHSLHSKDTGSWCWLGWVIVTFAGVEWMTEQVVNS